jgi:hypothetical protein
MPEVFSQEAMAQLFVSFLQQSQVSSPVESDSEEEEEEVIVPPPEPKRTIVSQKLLKLETGMQIEGSVEDELFNIDNKTVGEFMAAAAANPMKRYVATMPSSRFSINILHCQKLIQRLTAARLNANSFYQQNLVKREESLNQLAVTRSKVEDAKRVLESLLEEEEAVVLTGQALDLEIISCHQYFTQADVGLRICGVLKHFMEMITSLHDDRVQRTRLLFANVKNPQEQANLALIFGVEGYATTNLPLPAPTHCYRSLSQEFRLRA